MAQPVLTIGQLTDPFNPPEVTKTRTQTPGTHPGAHAPTEAPGSTRGTRGNRCDEAAVGQNTKDNGTFASNQRFA
jgi:hypothetical protein